MNETPVNGCLGCNACRYGKPCIQKDSFNELVPKIKEADCIVFASPLLFWTISSKLKAFVERFYCMLDIDISQQIGDEVILLMQVGILKTGHLQQELIKSDEMAHHGHDFVLLDKLVLLDSIVMLI